MDIEKMGADYSGKELTPSSEFEKVFQDWSKEEPELVEKIKADLLNTIGLSEQEMRDMDDDAFVKIPTEKLADFGTICGFAGNKFGEEGVDFLKSKDVGSIVAVCEKAEPRICAAMIKINQQDGELLSEIVNKNQGSLRCDSSRVEGWSMFESE